MDKDNRDELFFDQARGPGAGVDRRSARAASGALARRWIPACRSLVSVPQLRLLSGMDLSLHDGFFRLVRDGRFAPWTDALEQETAKRLCSDEHGDLPRWWEAVSALPDIGAGQVDLDAPCVSVQTHPPLDAAE